MGYKYADMETVDMATLVANNIYFMGDFNLFGDLSVGRKKIGYFPSEIWLDLDLIRDEWDLISGYVKFIERNKGLDVDYDGFKSMIKNSGSK